VFLNSIKGNNMAVMGKNKKNWSLNDKIKKSNRRSGNEKIRMREI